MSAYARTRRPSISTVSLDIVVIGASIAGLACSGALQKAGHRVTVLEKSDGMYRSHGLVRAPPNLTRILKAFHLGPELERVAVECSLFTFRVGATGEDIGDLKFHEKLMKDLGGEMSFIQHGDLHNILLQMAQKCGVAFKYNCPVQSIDPHTPSVTLEDGTLIGADLIFGADGSTGPTRKAVISDPSPETADERSYLLASVPVESMRSHPDLSALAEKPELSCWMSNNCSALGHLTNAGKEYSMCLVVPVQPEPIYSEGWFGHCRLSDLSLNLDAFEPRIRKLLELATHIIPTKNVKRGHAAEDNWVHESGKVALVGEAAHPLRPNGAYNAALAVEDGVTLGTLFSKLHDRSQVPVLLAAFEEIRQPRCSQISASDSVTRDFLGLSPGPEQEGRDAGFKHARQTELLDWESADEEYLVNTYSGYLQPFEYCAIDTVDEFWTKWGSWMDRGREDVDESLFVQISQDTAINVHVEVN